jgi:hypothetical protein
LALLLDWDEAERILVEAANEVNKEIIEQTGEEQFIRAELLDAGVLMRLRHKVQLPRRQEVSTNIVRIIFQKLYESKTVEFCYPGLEITYQWKGKVLLPNLTEHSEEDDDRCGCLAESPNREQHQLHLFLMMSLTLRPGQI